MSNSFSTLREDASAVTPRAGSSASLSYEPFYGLKEKPFSLSADPRFLFKSPSHAEALDALVSGIRRREGLIVVTGEIGTGKTTLCRSALQQLDRRTFASFVPDPFVSRDDLLKILLVDFGVTSINDVKEGRLRGASRPDLSYPLYEFLDSLVPLQAFAVLVIDEAQNLPLPLLEEIRILSDLERREKLLQVVLVGQPELRSNLRLPQMRQVDQRVSVYCEVAPLDAAGVAGYVNHRLGVASDGAIRAGFTPESLAAVYEGSSGVPRLINRICDRSLARAYSARTRTIDAAIVLKALDDLGLRRISTVSSQPPTLEIPPVTTSLAEESEPLAPSHVSTDVLRVARRAFLIALLAVGALLGATWYARSLATDGPGAIAMLPPAPPAPPRLAPVQGIAPAAVDAALEAPPIDGAAATSAPENYIIQVASFEGRTRSGRLVEELASAGFRAREVELDLGPPRGRLWQVIVGGYSSAIEVQRDLQRIREMPGYKDARLLDR